jgi:hypothetical protein
MWLKSDKNIGHFYTKDLTTFCCCCRRAVAIKAPYSGEIVSGCKDNRGTNIKRTHHTVVVCTFPIVLKKKGVLCLTDINCSLCVHFATG